MTNCRLCNKVHDICYILLMVNIKIIYYVWYPSIRENHIPERLHQ